MGSKKGQNELVDDLYPELLDDETAGKLDEASEIADTAKKHKKLMDEVKETIKGHVLSLSPEDQAVGKLKVGKHIIPFTVQDEEEKEVSFMRGGKKKVTLSFKTEDTEEE